MKVSIQKTIKAGKKVCQHHVKEGLIKAENKAILSEAVQPSAHASVQLADCCEPGEAGANSYLPPIPTAPL